MHRQRLRGEKRREGSTKSMSIVMFLGRNVNEYVRHNRKIIDQHIIHGDIRCEHCLKPLKRHSSYVRGIKETGQTIRIIMVWCRDCCCGHALVPDFLLPGKHYSGDEIEGVLIDAATTPVSQIETEASESTVRLWKRQVGEKIERTISIIKHLFIQIGQAVSELAIDAKEAYGKLEQLLEKAPCKLEYSGNKLGFANIWLGKYGRHVYI